MYPYDTVIFDLDGTLLNTLQDLADSTNYALALQGMPARTLEEVRRFVGNGVGRLIAGIFCDRIGGETTGIIAFVLAALGYLLLPHAGGETVVAALSACVGFGLGTLFTVTGPIASQRFGLKHFGAIFGLIYTAYGFVGGVLGPALSGVILDRTGAAIPPCSPIWPAAPSWASFS